MKNKKTDSFIYKGLGFPIKLINVPMTKILGEWVMDIDMNKFQLFIFHGLIHKPSRLTGCELKFLRKFLEMTTQDLGKKLGVTHPAILKWEKETAKMSLTQEIYLRMQFSEYLDHKEVLKIYKEIKPESLSKEIQEPLSINIKKMCLSA